MTAKIPEGYILAEGVDPKILAKKKYKQWTIADILEHAMSAGLSLDTPVWLTDTDYESDDWKIRPLEFIYSSEGHLFL